VESSLAERSKEGTSQHASPAQSADVERNCLVTHAANFHPRKILTTSAAGEGRDALQFHGAQQQDDAFILQLVTYDLPVVLDVADLTRNGNTLTVNNCC